MSKKTPEIGDVRAQAARDAARRQVIDRLRRMDGLDVDKSRVMDGGWRHELDIPDAAPD